MKEFLQTNVIHLCIDVDMNRKHHITSTNGNVMHSV